MFNFHQMYDIDRVYLGTLVHRATMVFVSFGYMQFTFIVYDLITILLRPTYYRKRKRTK